MGGSKGDGRGLSVSPTVSTLVDPWSQRFENGIQSGFSLKVGVPLALVYLYGGFTLYDSIFG